MGAKNGTVWKGKSIWPEIRDTLAQRRPVIVFDLETTGLSAKNDRIIEIAAIKYEVDDDCVMRETDTFHQYLNPERVVPDVVVELTGITNEMLTDKPTEQDVFPAIAAFFDGCTVSGYNIDNFDVKFMSELYGRMGKFFRPYGSIDCIKMARNRLLKGEDVADYKLSTVGAHFHLEFTAHSAIEDARTTGKLAQLFINEYLEDAKTPTVTAVDTLQPAVKTISFWPGFKGFSRIYVNTTMGSVYYDIRSQVWGGKDIDVSRIDMEYLEQEVFRLTGSANETEFSRFKGNIAV